MKNNIDHTKGKLSSRTPRSAFLKYAQSKPLLATEAFPDYFLTDKKNKSLPVIETNQSKSPCSYVDLVKSVSRIELNELKKSTPDIRTHEAFKPNWLDLYYMPSVVPIINKLKLRAKRSDHFVPLRTLEAILLLQGKSYPWSTIGNILNSQGMHGTGVLVGKNLLLTASHVIPWDDGSKGAWSMKFIPGTFGRSTPFGESYVESVHGIINTGGDVTGLDYAICKLYEPLGEITGYMGAHSGSDDDYKSRTWTSVGYPVNFDGEGSLPQVEFDIDIDDVDEDGDGREIETRPFTSGGWSGGPLWGMFDDDPRVIGVVSGREKEFSFFDFFSETHSVFAGGSPLIDLISFGRANWAV